MLKNYNRKLAKKSLEIGIIKAKIEKLEPSDPALMDAFYEYQNCLGSILELQNETLTGMEQAICNLVGLLEDIEETYEVESIHHKIYMAKEREPVFNN